MAKGQVPCVLFLTVIIQKNASTHKNKVWIHKYKLELEKYKWGFLIFIKIDKGQVISEENCGVLDFPKTNS